MHATAVLITSAHVKWSVDVLIKVLIFQPVSSAKKQVIVEMLFFGRSSESAELLAKRIFVCWDEQTVLVRLST